MNAPINNGGPLSDATLRDFAAIEYHKVIIAHRLATQVVGQAVNLRGEALAALQLADAFLEARANPFQPPTT